jgi:predicted molibdopterin-dependent oxidoreductase YjgC
MRNQAALRGLGDGKDILGSGFGLSVEIMRGEVFVPFVKLEEHAPNYLTNPAPDPTSRIPEYKVCAVRVEKLDASTESERGASAAARSR